MEINENLMCTCCNSFSEYSSRYQLMNKRELSSDRGKQTKDKIKFEGTVNAHLKSKASVLHICLLVIAHIIVC